MNQPRIIIPVGRGPRGRLLKEAAKEWLVTGLPFLAIAAIIAALLFLR